MNDILAAVADGMAERICTRVEARDRLEALDASEQGPTYRERLGSDLAAREALSIAAVEELLRILADAAGRDTLRAMDEGSRSAPSPQLMTTGLVVASWDGTSVGLSELGSAALRLFDSLTEGVAERVRQRLHLDDAG